MRLASWRRADRDIEFDPQTGHGELIVLPAARRDDAPNSGFAERERRVGGTRKCFAVYREGEDIYFSAGPERWRLGDSRLRFEHESSYPFVSSFRVIRSDAVVFAFAYAHVGRLLYALIDPTYDEIDRESDFFLEFIAEQASSPEWIQNVREGWTPQPSMQRCGGG